MADLENKLASAPEIPAWYPGWAKELADVYFSGSACLFVLHGNVHDLVRYPTPEGDQFQSLSDFLSQRVFGLWDSVVAYDLGRGLRPEAGPESARLQEMVKQLSGIIGNPSTWPRDPDQVLDLIDRVVQRNLLDETQRKRIAFLFEHSQYLIPSGDLASLARGPASRLVRFMSWARNPYIKRVNMAFCLISEKLSEVNERLVQNPHVAAIEVPMPDAETRRAFLQSVVGKGAADGDSAPAAGSMSIESLTQLSSGLNLVNLNVVVRRAGEQSKTIDAGRFRQLKKTMIERQCQSLVSFVEPDYKLDVLVGHEAAKKQLAQDAQWIAEGRLDTSPMGYLVCGPVGTGKSFLAECYAGSIGIPCVTLRNFRSKYVGETEGNLEQVLTVLRSLGPVVVIVDEADAALGNRQQEGDSGTSSRVFSMIASQMGNTRYRGRIIWILLTSRPDLLPIDLKRQGRAEVHIPLFYPDKPAEIAEMFRTMAKKNKIPLAPEAVPEVSVERHLSGADIESIVLASRRSALSAGRESPTADDLRNAVETFIPSAQGLEKEMQELAAVLECTDRSFLPERWRTIVDQPDGRSRLQRRLVELRAIVES